MLRCHKRKIYGYKTKIHSYKAKYINFMKYFNIENWVLIIKYKMGLNLFNKKYTIHAQEYQHVIE